MEEQYITTNTAGKYYYKDKAKTILHRTDGPAVEYADGDRSWYVNGIFIISVDEEGTVIDRMR